MCEGDFEEYVEGYELVMETIDSLNARKAKMEEENPYYKKVLDFYQKSIVSLKTPSHYIMEAYRLFRKLHPFAHRKAVIRVEDGGVLDFYDALVISNDIRAGFYSSLCKKRRRGEVLSEHHFIEVVTKYHEKIVPHLRKPIQEAFEELVELAKKLRLGLTITQRCDGYFLYRKAYRSEIMCFVKIPCREISISMDAPLEEIKVICDKDVYHLSITRKEDLFALYKPIYEAYQRFHEEWSEIQRKNDEILERMRKVVGEYVLVNEL